jgi:putative oxidoreductase
METEDLGKLVLRLTLGVLLLFHGTHKILTGIGPIRGMVTAHHLPDFLAYFVYLGEVVAPVLIIIGLLTRLGGLLVVINMIVALLLAHTGMLFGTNEMGGYLLELQAFYLFSGLTVALLGAGRFSIGGAEGPLN